jgi:hypothetical protein
MQAFALSHTNCNCDRILKGCTLGYSRLCPQHIALGGCSRPVGFTVFVIAILPILGPKPYTGGLVEPQVGVQMVTLINASSIRTMLGDRPG